MGFSSEMLVAQGKTQNKKEKEDVLEDIRSNLPLVQMLLHQVFIRPLHFKLLSDSLYRRVLAVIPICSMRKYCYVLTIYKGQV